MGQGQSATATALGDGISATTPSHANSNEEKKSQSEQHFDPMFCKMADRPPLHCVFYYETEVKSGQLKLPLVYAKPDDEAPGTRLMDLELWLRGEFNIPDGSSVFAVLPAEELYSPPYPLVMINIIAGRLYNTFEDERVPVLHFGLVVREMVLLRQPMLRNTAYDSPYFPISAAALGQRQNTIERQFARMRLVQNMQKFGFIRLEVTPEQAKVPLKAFESVRKWLMSQCALPPAERWRDRVDGRAENDDLTSTHPQVSRGRYVGFGMDSNREYLQLRRPIAASGTVWPPPYFQENEAFAHEILTVLNLLDDIARDCMRAICDLFHLDVNWMLSELLDDTTPPPHSPNQVTSVDKSYQYGASVLRFYHYQNKTEHGPVKLDDHSCGVHADLGLITVSPVATIPGLQMWNLDRMTWTDVEADAEYIHFSVFAGETLGLITNGMIKAPLHRVPAMSVDTHGKRRMSMPYFLRARPEKILNPLAEPPEQITCRDFMEEVVFKKRPWRRDDRNNAPPPDY